MASKHPLLPLHSATASGVFFATAAQGIFEALSGIDGNNGFPTAEGFPITGTICFSGSNLWQYNGGDWVKVGGLNSYNAIKARVF